MTAAATAKKSSPPSKTSRTAPTPSSSPPSTSPSAFSAVSASRALELARVDRKRPDALAGERVDRVADGGGDAGDAGLAEAAGFVAGVENVDLDQGHLVDSQHLVVVEVGLLDASLVDRDLPVIDGGQ